MQDYHIFDTKEKEKKEVKDQMRLRMANGKGMTRHKCDGGREEKWYLKSYVMADLTFFHLVLINGVDVLLHLYDASGGQRVFPLVLNKENR